MDGLALLCNLHADGPLSLRRLRRAGLQGLEQLQGVPEASLAGVLQASPTQARRFLTEARLLSARIEDTVGATELTPRPEVVPGEERAPRPGARPAARVLRPAAVAFDLPRIARQPVAYGAPAEDEPAHVASREPNQVEERSLERRDPWALPERAAPPEPRVEAAPARPAAEPVEGTLIRAGEIEGLDTRLCERLVEQGVRTYRSLVDLSSLSLARRLHIPYTRLLDLQYHARRFLAKRILPRPKPTRSATSEPRTTAVREYVLPARPQGAGAYRPGRVFEGARLEPRVLPAPAPREKEKEPGVAGPFV